MTSHQVPENHDFDIDLKVQQYEREQELFVAQLDCLWEIQEELKEKIANVIEKIANCQSSLNTLQEGQDWQSLPEVD